MTHHHEPSTDDAVMLEIEHVLDAPREAVWAAFTDAEQLQQWFGPEGSHVRPDSVQVSPVVGGPYRLTMVSDVNADWESPISATVVQADPGRLLEIEEPVTGTDDGVPMSVTLRLLVELLDEGTGTRVRMTQGPFPAMVAENGRLGWESSFRRLAQLLAR